MILFPQNLSVVGDSIANPVTGLSIDANVAEVFTLTLFAEGTFSFAQTDGLSFMSGDGSDDRIVSITGLVSDINAALATMTYSPALSDRDGDIIHVMARGSLVKDVGLPSTVNLSLTGLNAAHAFDTTTIEGVSPAHKFNGVGDINGDGIDDFYVGTAETNDLGYIVFGGLDGFSADIDFSAGIPADAMRIFGQTNRSNLYYTQLVEGIGDINGDGYNDILVKTGARSSSHDYAIIYGAEHLPASAVNIYDMPAGRGTYLDGTRQQLDIRLAGLGDINGDGLSDFAIGNPDYEFGRDFNLGGTHIFFGKEDFASIERSLVFDEDAYLLEGRAEGDYAGFVAGLGDIDGDGFDDYAIGAPEASFGVGAYGGNISVIYGGGPDFNDRRPVTNLDGTNGFIILGPNGSSYAGHISSAGDFNGDGFSDLLIGAPGVNRGTYGNGTAFLVYGGERLGERFFDLSELSPEQGFQIFGTDGIDNLGHTDYGLESIGDFNGDGFDDILLGTKQNVLNDTLELLDHAYVIFGTPDGMPNGLSLDDLDGTNGFRITDRVEGQARFRVDEFRSISGLGDINGDGYTDIGIATPDSAFIIYGRGSLAPSHDIQTVDVSITSPHPLDWILPSGFTPRVDLPDLSERPDVTFATTTETISGNFTVEQGAVYAAMNTPPLALQSLAEALAFENRGAIWLETDGPQISNLTFTDAQTIVNAGSIFTGTGSVDAQYGSRGFEYWSSSLVLLGDESKAEGASGSLNNNGTIETVSFTSASGVRVLDHWSTIENTGSIYAWSATASASGIQIDARPDGSEYKRTFLDNSGTIEAINYAAPPEEFLRARVAAVAVRGELTVENSGELLGRSFQDGNIEYEDEGVPSHGVFSFTAGLQVINSGLIDAQFSIAVLGSTSDSAKSGIENSASGVIRGDIYMSESYASITNAGLIEGDVTVLFGGSTSYSREITLQNSGLIIGDMRLGFTDPDNTDLLERLHRDHHIVQIANTGTIDGDLGLGLFDDVYNGQGGSVSGLIRLGGGDDSATGGVTADRIFGGSGNDTISGGGGDDILDGGEGADLLDGGEGNDTVSFASATQGVIVDLAAGTSDDGSGQSDTFISIENLIGSSFNDTLRGDANENTINGGDGDDILIGRGRDDTLIGGAGLDVADYSDDPSGITVNLRDSVVAGLASMSVRDGWGGLDMLIDVETVLATAFDDRFYGGDADEVFITRGGADRILAGQGDDTLEGGLGDDLLNGGGGFDTVSYINAAFGAVINLDSVSRGGQAALTASDGDGGTDTLVGVEFVLGSSHDDRVFGTEGRNTLNGGDGNDFIRGRGGNDTLIGGVGDDNLDGQSGLDTVSYEFSGSQVDVDLGTGIAQDGDGGTDTLSGIEQVIGSAHNDVITADGANNVVFAGAGADLVRGEGGNDSLFGQDGIDQLFGGDGTDRLYGGNDSDLLIGGAGTDILDGGAANDRLEGGDGGDRMFGRDGNDRMFGQDGFDIMNGQEGDDQLSGGADRDILRGQEGDDLLNGDEGDDTLAGGIGADDLFGGLGNDLLKGDEGDDELQGGAGNDRLIGGEGDDVAIYLGNFADYDISYRGGVVRITDSIGDRDGFDKLTGVETLQFADGVIDVAALG